MGVVSPTLVPTDSPPPSLGEKRLPVLESGPEHQNGSSAWSCTHSAVLGDVPAPPGALPCRACASRDAARHPLALETPTEFRGEQKVWCVCVAGGVLGGLRINLILLFRILEKMCTRMLPGTSLGMQRFSRWSNGGSKK